MRPHPIAIDVVVAQLFAFACVSHDILEGGVWAASCDATSWYNHHGTIVLTWDEGNSNAGRYGDRGGHVLTIVISARTKGSKPHSGYLDTAGILRSVESAYGLSYLGKAARTRSGMISLVG